MILWRLTPKAHAKRALTGYGAALRGGRWNSKGVPAVYASFDAATTVLEALVTFDPEDAPEGGFRLLQLEMPDDVPLFEPGPDELPEGWDWSERSPRVQRYGDAFLRAGEYLGMIVPSATLQEARNAVINPLHARASAIRIARTRRFDFDPRWPLRKHGK